MLSRAGYQLLPEIQVEGWSPLNPVRSSLVQVYTALLNSTMTATIDRLPCKGSNLQERQRCQKSYLQVCRAGRVRHTFIPPRMQVIGGPHSSYPRKLHMPMRSREAHRHEGRPGVTQCASQFVADRRL